MLQEKHAKILVNPRPSKEKFTKYSFPSKTLEYLASGTVAIITKLEGIPNEYYEYCYTFEEENIDGLAKGLNEIMNKSDQELENKARKAKNFVMYKKNNSIQVSRILKFLKDI